MASVLPALAAGEPIEAPVAVVAAHQDDETIGMGSRLSCLKRMTLVHVTDGSPLDLADARREGFTTREAYAAARWAELDRALELLDARPLRHVKLGQVDQAAAEQLVPLTRRLVELLAGQAAVISMPYEGGHPDHDACAFVVQAACARMTAPPERLEFACYASGEGGFRPNRFHPDPRRPERMVALSAGEGAAKRAAIAAFATQPWLGRVFPVGVESYRAAPEYDFAAPPPTGVSHYDGYGWAITSGRWRVLAAEAAEALRP